MSQWRVKIKQDQNCLGRNFLTWELQEKNLEWATMAEDYRDHDEWEWAGFGEAKDRETALKDAMNAKRLLQEERRMEAEAEYVSLD